MTSHLARVASIALLLCLTPFAFAKDFTTYKNTNQLVWDKEFKPVLASFFGSRKASFLRKNGLIWKQALEDLGGPPEDITEVSPGLYLAPACRAHSCDEKAAVVIQSPNRIVAVGLIEYGCYSPTGCSERPTLQVFVHQRNARAEQAISDWAESAVGGLSTQLTILK